MYTKKTIPKTGSDRNKLGATDLSLYTSIVCQPWPTSYDHTLAGYHPYHAIS